MPNEIVEKINAIMTGFTGLIGNSIYKNLLLKNYSQIFCLTRRKINKNPDPKTYIVEYNYQNLEERLKAIKNPSEMKWDIFLFTGESIFSIINYKKWQRIRDSRITINQKLISVLEKTDFNIRRIFAASAIGIYYGNSLEEVNEDSPISSNLVSSLIKEWEETVLNSIYKDKAVIMRIGAVLDKNSKISQSLRLPSLFSIGISFKGSTYFPWIYLEEIPSIIDFLIKKDWTGIVNVVAPSYITYEDFVRKFVEHKSLLKKALIINVSLKTLKSLLQILMKDYYEMIFSLFQSPKIIPQRLLDLGYNYSFPTLESVIEKI